MIAGGDKGPLDLFGSNRIILDHEFRSTLPFPVATAFYHYCSGSRAGALRAQRLFIAFESTLRYASMVALADYSTSSNPDEEILSVLRNLLFSPYKRGLAMGTWVEVLRILLGETRRSWQDKFLPEFEEIDAKWLNEVALPAVEKRNEIAHGERVSHLALQGITQNLEPNLYAILQRFQFLVRYNLCLVPLEYLEEEIDRAGPIGLHLCCGSSADFYETMIRPSNPIPIGVPFIWNRTCDQILTLEPFLLYGRTELKNQRTGVAIAAEGLMVYDGSHHYRAVNQEVRISFRSMQHPGPEVLKTNMDQALTGSQTVPERFPVSLDEDDVSKLYSRPEDIPEGAELSGARDAYVIAGQPIAYGGMSTIYLARRNKDSKICVLKVMPLVLNTQPALVKRFTREGWLAQTLENDHIVKILDSGYSHSQYFLVMEYIEGGSLADELWRRSGQSPPFSLDETLTLIRQIATGLQVVHRKNMVHRDLKPSNIMLETRRDSDESVQVIAKVTDFGLVRRVGDQSAALTATLDQLGTFEYMAPEQFHGKNAEIDHRADIYAIGKILCVMLSGKIPNNIREVEGVDFGTFLPSDEDTKNNEGIKQVIQRCMAENPDDRFQNVEDFLEALERLNELDMASSFLREAGITLPEVKVAFSMANIGQTDAQKKIMQLVTTSSDEEIHYQASLASSELPHGMDEIIKLQRPSSYRKMDLYERTNLNKALFHIVRFRESFQPKLGGEPWVRALNPNVRRRLFLNLIRFSVWEKRTKFWEYVLFYGGMAAIAGGMTGVLCSLFEASIFWRISAPGTPYWSKVVLSMGPSFFGCSAWAGLGSSMGWIGSKLPRPARFLAIVGGGAISSLLLGLLFWLCAWAFFPPIAEISDHVDKVTALPLLFQRFFFWGGAIGRTRYVQCFCN